MCAKRSGTSQSLRVARTFLTKTAHLTVGQIEVDAAETEWLELEMLKAELQG